MRYISVNELNCFSYHDTLVEGICFIGDKMVWNVSDLNATTENTQNDHPVDMCIQHASMEFEDARICKIIIRYHEPLSPDDKKITGENLYTALPDEYEDIVQRNLLQACYLDCAYDLIQTEDGSYRFSFGINATDYYEMTISFSKATISWDEYKGVAWYEGSGYKKR